ncbi:hypothetical protein BPAE_1310g00010 [Botrytis paeoniae]|uniref:Retrovirus-related Pol polyprotein from transposon TNT 1-94-like beta-barrel domain-containing protein n=1 Tax=Botrytis paeoniae TaxID=278948 RepID=A0A4Z1EBG8_9HELO|nr:hypothetical protein BPAE_1310g00010 [Botrytis paeoniae]
MEFEYRIGPRESIKENALSIKIQSKGFKGKCFNCRKGGHRKADYRKPKKDSNSSNTDSPSTGPLSTPSGGRGLSPRAEQAKTAEISWMANISQKCSQEPIWIVDSGCSRHMTYTKKEFILGAIIKTINKGTIILKIKIEGEIRLTPLTRILYVLGLVGSLILVLQFQDKGLTITTTTSPEKKLLIQYQGVTVGTACRIGHAYTLEGPDQYKINSLKAFKSIEAPKQKDGEL